MLRVRPLLLAVGLSLGCAVSALASVILPLSLDELIDRADVVVHGKVVAQDSAWEGGRIVSRSRVRVEGALKGAPGREVVLRSQGGVVDGIGQKVYGEASFAVGEELVVFGRHLGAELRAVGMAQGKFRVVTELGVARAVQDLAGLAFAKREAASGAPLRIDHADGARPTLAALFSRIAERVAQSRAKQP